MPIENVTGVHRPVTTGLNADPQVRGNWQQGMEITQERRYMTSCEAFLLTLSSPALQRAFANREMLSQIRPLISRVSLMTLIAYRNGSATLPRSISRGRRRI